MPHGASIYPNCSRWRAAVLLLQLGDQLRHAAAPVNRPNALATTPDVFPGFGRSITTKIHFAGIGLGQVLRVEACSQIDGAM